MGHTEWVAKIQRTKSWGWKGFHVLVFTYLQQSELYLHSYFALRYSLQNPLDSCVPPCAPEVSLWWAVTGELDSCILRYDQSHSLSALFNAAAHSKVSSGETLFNAHSKVSSGESQLGSGDCLGRHTFDRKSSTSTPINIISVNIVIKSLCWYPKDQGDNSVHPFRLSRRPLPSETLYLSHALPVENFCPCGEFSDVLVYSHFHSLMVWLQGRFTGKAWCPPGQCWR